ncbi:MAG: response regulator [Desulfobacterales bacterium]|nr:response regulator [Desulfobacterales bacterium]
MGENEVLVLDADENLSKSLSDLLADNEYRPVALNSLAHFESHTKDHDCRALILNLDNVTVTNKILRELKRKKPHLNIIALSGRQFHPELEEAIRHHISVCLAKPVDADELIFWLKSVFENNDGPSA